LRAVERAFIEEAINGAMNPVRARLRYRIDLRAEITAHPGFPEMSEHLNSWMLSMLCGTSENKTLPPHAHIFIIIV